MFGEEQFHLSVHQVAIAARTFSTEVGPSKLE